MTFPLIAVEPVKIISIFASTRTFHHRSTFLLEKDSLFSLIPLYLYHPSTYIPNKIPTSCLSSKDRCFALNYSYLYRQEIPLAVGSRRIYPKRVTLPTADSKSISLIPKIKRFFRLSVVVESLPLVGAPRVTLPTTDSYLILLRLSLVVESLPPVGAKRVILPTKDSQYISLNQNYPRSPPGVGGYK